MNDVGVKLQHVTKAYNKHIVLDDVSVEFEVGKIHGIIGRNGSGKTQLFKVIAGYVAADRGETVVFDKVVGKQINHPDSMGILLETPGFLSEYSGFFNLQLLAAMNTKLTAAEIENALSDVGLKDAGHKKVKTYSLGMRQRLGIAQAIMGNPQLVILDEPFNGLDHVGVEEIRKLILRLKENGKTVLLASHYAEDIEYLCDTVHRMEAGVIRKA